MTGIFVNNRLITRTKPVLTGLQNDLAECARPCDVIVQTSETFGSSALQMT